MRRIEIDFPSQIRSLYHIHRNIKFDTRVTDGTYILFGVSKSGRSRNRTIGNQVVHIFAIPSYRTPDAVIPQPVIQSYIGLSLGFPLQRVVSQRRGIHTGSAVIGIGFHITDIVIITQVLRTGQTVRSP